MAAVRNPQITFSLWDSLGHAFGYGDTDGCENFYGSLFASPRSLVRSLGGTCVWRFEFSLSGLSFWRVRRELHLAYCSEPACLLASVSMWLTEWNHNALRSNVTVRTCARSFSAWPAQHTPYSVAFIHLLFVNTSKHCAHKTSFWLPNFLITFLPKVFGQCLLKFQLKV